MGSPIKFLLLFFVASTGYPFSLKDIGIKLRLGVYQATHPLKSEDSGINLKEAKREAITKFPIIPVFRSRIRGKNYYTKIFFDYEFPSKSLNLGVDSGNNRTQIENSFIQGSTETTFIGANPNWVLTADVKATSIAIGYQWGVFYDFSSNIRAFKVGAGFNTGFIDYKYKLYLCSSYVSNPEKISTFKISSGTCNDKTQIDEIDFTGIGFGIALNFTLLEFDYGSWLMSLFEFDAGSLRPLSDERFDNRPGTPKVDAGTDYTNIDIVNFSYFF